MVEIGQAASRFEGTNRGFRASPGSNASASRAVATRTGKQGVHESHRRQSSGSRSSSGKKSSSDRILQDIADESRGMSYSKPTLEPVKDSSGKIIGVHDKALRQTYRVDATEKEITRAEAERYNQSLRKTKMSEPKSSRDEAVLDRSKNILEILSKRTSRQPERTTEGQRWYDKIFRTEKDRKLVTVKGKVYSIPQKGPIEKQIANFAEGAAGTVFTFSRSLLKPKKTLSDIKTGVKYIASDPIGAIKATAQRAKEDPARFAGEIVIGGELGGITLKPFKYVGGKLKSSYVKAGSKYIPPAEEFSEQVISGNSKMPKTGSIEESVAKFKATKDFSGKIRVSTASPAKMKGKEAAAGRKGSVGLEDPGIYVTPAGEGSPAFLRITDDLSIFEYRFSLNPLKGAFDIPTVTEITARNVKVLPKSIKSKPGFKSVEEYFKEIPKGDVYITKRSEIGQGTVKAQRYVADKDFKLPMKEKTVIRNEIAVKLKEGDLVKKGDVLFEAGTSELEGIIPVGSRFKYKPQTVLGKIKGFDYYTEYKGKVVAIRKADLIEEASSTLKNIRKKAINNATKKTKATSTQPSQVISANKLLKESSYNPNVSYVTPASALKYTFAFKIGSKPLIGLRPKKKNTSGPKPAKTNSSKTKSLIKSQAITSSQFKKITSKSASSAIKSKPSSILTGSQRSSRLTARSASSASKITSGAIKSSSLSKIFNTNKAEKTIPAETFKIKYVQVAKKTKTKQRPKSEEFYKFTRTLDLPPVPIVKNRRLMPFSGIELRG